MKYLITATPQQNALTRVEWQHVMKCDENTLRLAIGLCVEGALLNARKAGYNCDKRNGFHFRVTIEQVS